ncbi:MAG: S41 family peptidase [Patiriisocius sp.]|uniref:S41 family peptidase n=1 Tax=Patiriisocius sp. TaxID=2822396 RepID=UPI003EF775B9
MRKINIYGILFLLLIGCKGFSQDEQISEKKENNSKIILDSIIRLSKSKAYNSSQMDWDTLSKEMYHISEQFDSIDKIGKPTEHMFKSLGDFHGMLIYDYKVAYSYTPENGGIPKDSLWRKITTSKIKLPYEVLGKMIKNNTIAYLEIVGTGMMQEADIKQAREKIREVICSLKAKNPMGWILDLRCNIGGNMHPMLAGLGELIPDANLGGDTTDGINFNNSWSLKNGIFLENEYAHYPEKLQCPELKSKNRIAVLTSRFTASSGEVVVSSLKGQNNINLIGEKTAGLSSTNGWYVLSDKWILAPMEAYFMSKDKTVHKDGIHPHIRIIEPLDLNNLTQGATIDAAIKWIESENN